MQQNYNRHTLLFGEPSLILNRLAHNLEEMGKALLDGRKEDALRQGADSASYIMLLLEMHDCLNEETANAVRQSTSA
jgi:hypothetical protein